MPKHPNNRSWPENLAFDFELPMLSPAAAEAFISTLPTTERNKEFLRLRYRGDKTYAEIAAIHGMTPAGVRLAIIAMQEKFGGAAISTQVTAVEKVVPQSATMQPPASANTPPFVPAAPAGAPPLVGDDAAIALPTVPTAPPLPAKDAQTSRPLSINLAAVRRFLGLTVEEFARPLPIEDGDSLITRLETGFSKASAEIVQLLCEAWGISKSYLLTGRGEMFDLQPYCDGLVSLLKKYLSVATFDRQGQQYWKRSLVDDLMRLIDVGKLNGREMCRVVRVLYDYVDVEQFAELLERMGR